MYCIFVRADKSNTGMSCRKLHTFFFFTVSLGFPLAFKERNLKSAPSVLHLRNRVKIIISDIEQYGLHHNVEETPF